MTSPQRHGGTESLQFVFSVSVRLDSPFPLVQANDPLNRRQRDNGWLALVVGAGSVLLSAGTSASLWMDYTASPRTPGDAMAYPLGGCILASYGVPGIGLALAALWRLCRRGLALTALRVFALITGLGLIQAVVSGLIAPTTEMPETMGRIIRAVPFFLLLADAALVVRLYSSE